MTAFRWSIHKPACIVMVRSLVHVDHLRMGDRCCCARDYHPYEDARRLPEVTTADVICTGRIQSFRREAMVEPRLHCLDHGEIGDGHSRKDQEEQPWHRHEPEP